ncbi:hypothetical protein ACLVWQ_25160 [Streptomyces sp. CWNU-52B]|uniref:hypothetical protein n=1 Tax=unclassified Streptomyces TaxID=2593676 RepID=UPI0039C277A5
MATRNSAHSGPEQERDFRREVQDLVNAAAPCLFAVVEEYATDDGDRDARVAAWGLAHKDGSAQVATVSGGLQMSLRSPERAVQLISLGLGGVGTLVWPGADSDASGLLA